MTGSRHADTHIADRRMPKEKGTKNGKWTAAEPVDATDVKSAMAAAKQRYAQLEGANAVTRWRRHPTNPGDNSTRMVVMCHQHAECTFSMRVVAARDGSFEVSTRGEHTVPFNLYERKNSALTIAQVRGSGRSGCVRAVAVALYGT